MRIASEASRKDERKGAAEKLLTIDGDIEVASFLQNLSLKDKAKSLRSWLRARLTGNRKQATLRRILERSLFEGGRDLDDDIRLYIQITGGSTEAVEILCHACANNPRAIGVAAQELPENELFKRFLVTCLSFSTSSWREAANALSRLDVTQPEKDAAFAERLARTKDKYDLVRLSETAALNHIRLPKLFELSEYGYKNEIDGWRADDYLFYCYFYDQTKYLNDVLFHAFRDTSDSFAREISASAAFSAYCWVHRPDLHRAVGDERSYFYVDPSDLVGEQEKSDEDCLPPDIMNQLRQLARVAYEQARNIKPDEIIRKPASPPS